MLIYVLLFYLKYLVICVVESSIIHLNLLYHVTKLLSQTYMFNDWSSFKQNFKKSVLLLLTEKTPPYCTAMKYRTEQKVTQEKCWISLTNVSSIEANWPVIYYPNICTPTCSAFVTFVSFLQRKSNSQVNSSQSSVSI